MFTLYANQRQEDKKLEEPKLFNSHFKLYTIGDDIYIKVCTTHYDFCFRKTPFTQDGFQAVNSWFVKDRLFVWSIDTRISDISGVSIQPLVDSSSFVSIDDNLPHIAKDFYSFIGYRDSKVDRFLAPSVDATYLGYAYFKDKDNIYSYSNGRGFTEYKELKGKNIKPISRDYIWVDNKIYKLTYIASSSSNVFKEIEGADPNSFKLLENKFNSNIDKKHLYTLDKNNVYYKGQIIIDADPQTFKTIVWGNIDESYEDANICWHYISRDRSHVFYDGKKIEGINPETFKLLTQNTTYIGCGGSYDIYMSDGVSVYYGHKKLEGADASTFKVILDNYARDSKFFYEAGNIISSNPDETEKTLRDQGKFIIRPYSETDGGNI